MAATVLDVAAYILQKQGSVSAMKLQKLVYYSQAWHAVWEEQPLFEERIEAWANGPVVPVLYQQHKGKFRVEASDIDGDAGALSASEAESVDIVLQTYGDKNPQWLSDLTHAELPWIEARGDTPPLARSNAEIGLASMMEYYSGLDA
jgi:uncharacterized phage-associated protein